MAIDRSTQSWPDTIDLDAVATFTTQLIVSSIAIDHDRIQVQGWDAVKKRHSILSFPPESTFHLGDVLEITARVVTPEPQPSATDAPEAAATRKDGI